MKEELTPGGSNARPTRWTATWRRWLEALNAFLEKSFLQSDVETGC